MNDYKELVEKLRNAAGGDLGRKMCREAADAIEQLGRDIFVLTKDRDEFAKTSKEKLIDILSIPIHPRIGADYTEVVADYLLDNDVLPVVRCKDCRWWKYEGEDDVLIPPTCYDFNEEHFCSYGERKDDDGS